VGLLAFSDSAVICLWIREFVLASGDAAFADMQELL
jgi:hypothetical protein